MKYLWFGNLQEVVGKLVFEIWNIKEAAVNQFTHFSYEILMVLESPGSCWNHIDVEGSRGRSVKLPEFRSHLIYYLENGRGNQYSCGGGEWCWCSEL